MKPLKIIFIFILSFSTAGDTFALSVAVPDKIRVALAENADNISIAIKGPYKITTIETDEVLKKGDILWQGELSVVRNGIRLKTFKEEDFKIYGINIIPEKEPSIYMGKSVYRGILQILKTKAEKLSAINILDLEDYIKGVLYHEISHTWPVEAIKAQAIASRTYAIYQSQQKYNDDFYLNADVSSQVYKGAFAEKFRTNKAVEETTGEILMHRGKVLPAFFHATCGGKTEKASTLWKVSSRPLRGIRCSFCVNSPYYNWKNTISLDEIHEKLNIRGKIKSIKVISRTRSGRAKVLRIKADEKIKIRGKDFRNMIGPRNLKSTNFNIKVKADEAKLTGNGWGHGVGMCQWGAFAMAKKGYNYKQILEHYYPGAKIVRMTK